MRVRLFLVVASLAACGRLAAPGDGAPDGSVSFDGSDLGPCSDGARIATTDCPGCSGVAYAVCSGSSFSTCLCEGPPTSPPEPFDATTLEDGGPDEVSTADVQAETGTILPITASGNGYVSAGDGNAGINGAWYAYGDGWGTEGFDGGTGAAGERGSCELQGGFPVSDCSTITSPLPPAPAGQLGGIDSGTSGYAAGFPPRPGPGAEYFCLSGTAATVIVQDGGTSPDYADIWGIGMALDFNNVDGVKAPYDAVVHDVVGFQFTVTSSGVFPPLRVEFPTEETADGGPHPTGDPYDIQVSAPGIYTVLWSQFAGPPVVGQDLSYVPTVDGGLSAQPAFDPLRLLSIQFHVPTNVTGPIAVNDLCVSLSAIVSSSP